MTDNNYQHTIGLKITEREVNAKILMYLKKETKLGLSEIKNKVNKGDFIFLFDATNDKGLWKINAAKRVLAQSGLTPRLYLDNREKESTFFDNLERTYRESARESGLTEEDIDALYWDV